MQVFFSASFYLEKLKVFEFFFFLAVFGIYLVYREFTVYRVMNKRAYLISVSASELFVSGEAQGYDSCISVSSFGHTFGYFWTKHRLPISEHKLIFLSHIVTSLLCLSLRFIFYNLALEL